MAKLAALVGAALVSFLMLVWSARAFGPSSLWFAFVVVWLPMVMVGLLSRVVQVRLPGRYHGCAGSSAAVACTSGSG